MFAHFFVFWIVCISLWWVWIVFFFLLFRKSAFHYDVYESIVCQLVCFSEFMFFWFYSFMLQVVLCYFLWLVWCSFSFAVFGFMYLLWCFRAWFNFIFFSGACYFMLRWFRFSSCSFIFFWSCFFYFLLLFLCYFCFVFRLFFVLLLCCFFVVFLLFFCCLLLFS